MFHSSLQPFRYNDPTSTELPGWVDLRVDVRYRCWPCSIRSLHTKWSLLDHYVVFNVIQFLNYSVQSVNQRKSMKAKFSEYMFCTDHYYLSMKSRVYLSDVVCIFLSILSFSRENTECMYSSIAPRSNRDSLFRSFSLSFSSETINAPIHRFTQYRVHTIQNISIKALVSYQC